MIEGIKEQQRRSICSWTNYLAREDCPYPIWFKVYTIDGVSKMSTFDNGKKVFRKRDKGTVAPYPHFNAAVLSKVYTAIADFYGIDSDLSASEGKESRDGQEAKENERADRDVELEALVRSGNFNKLYSRLLMSEKHIVKTPERAEDVHGEWVEYGIGQEEEIASAADGTPWCIASPSVAGSYLTTGGYGQKSDKNSNSKAKFILFRLQDEDGRLADNACASIRLDTEGKVAEISGLNEGQALEDSLVDTVEEKVKDLPADEVFLKRFADKRMLIALDRKMQSGEDLTYDELRFVWEIDRPIETLDTYNAKDPRIKELRAKYNIDKLLSVAGSDIDINRLVSNLEPDEIFSNLDSLLAAGANVDELVSKFYSDQIANNLGRFLAAGANIDVLVSKLEPFEIANNLDKLLAAGADINGLVSKLEPIEIANNLDKLLAAGANINVAGLAPKLDTYAIARNLGSLLAAGANIDVDGLMSELGPTGIAYNLDSLLAAGAVIDIDGLVSKLDARAIARNLGSLLAAGANIDVDRLMSELGPSGIANNLDSLLAAGVDIDVDGSMSEFDDLMSEFD